MKTKYLFALPLMLLTACNSEASSDSIQRKQQELMLKQGTQVVGMPDISNFAERKLLKDILELRDKMPPTITYVMDMNGHLHKRCDSLGYGIPYATQFTSPQRPASYSETTQQGNIVLPQADPNGLFSPASAEGTWVLCLNPETKLAVPLYIEDRITVSPFALKDQ